jgi:hypothetical protein
MDLCHYCKKDCNTNVISHISLSSCIGNRVKSINLMRNSF